MHILRKLYFTGANWMSSAFSIDFLEPTSDFQMPVTFLLVDKNIKCVYSFSKFDRKENLVIKLSEFAEIFTFSTSAPMVSVLAVIAHYATSSLL